MVKQRWVWVVVTALLVATGACEETSGLDLGTATDTVDSDVIDDTGQDAPEIFEDPVEVDRNDDPIADSSVDLASDTNALDLSDVDADLPGRRSRFEVAGEDFYRLPWPLDARRQSDGRLELSDFPGPTRPITNDFLALLEREVRGFSTMPVVYVAWDGPPERLELPSPAQTLGGDATVRLVSVGPGDCGEPTPLLVSFEAVGNAYVPANVLLATPVPGFMLPPGATVALIVTTDLADDLVTPTELGEALAGDHADGAINDAFAPLRDCLSDLSLTAEEVAAATVFSIQDARAELLAIRDSVMDSQRTPAPEVQGWQLEEDRSQAGQYTTWSGEYDTPIYQRGESPYSSAGGGFVFDDETGQPVIQRWETVPFVITVPDHGTAPYPILIWIDGTGASLRGHITSSPIQDALTEGLAVASFAPQFHDTRAVPGSDPTIHSFNWLNGEAGRTVFRQQAVDTSYFVRVLREALPGLEGLPELDTARLVYAGQSQGSLIGAMVAGVEPEIAAFALNGTGAYISATLVERKDPIDIAELLQTLLQVDDEITVLHPVVQLVQLGADPVDVHNYAYYWSGWEAHDSGSHVFLTSGANDPTTPQRLINHLTIVGDLAPVSPPGWDVDPANVWTREAETTPISGNRLAQDGSALTLASFLDADQGHYTIYREDAVRAQFIRFLTSAVEGTPVIP